MVDTTVAVGKLKHLPPITALFYLTVHLPRRRKIQGGVNLSHVNYCTGEWQWVVEGDVVLRAHFDSL